ncbi:hypothetical protein ACFQ7O_24150 [Streptomyces sp. NPDC056485]|uniref:hypothetical protein n=1 Tax=Streptomyces sp. NPDC056485 TaxID=3345834 RepID=UPI0036BD51F1
MADPTWQNTIAYDGLELRNADSMFVQADGTALGSRPGVRPGDPGLTTTLAGSTINVSAGVALLTRAAQGVYRVALPASSSPGTVNAAHATLPRVDLVYLRCWDTDVDASGLRKGEAVYLAGTASASPSAPTPAGTQIYIPLATISVPASGGGSPTVSLAVRPVTVAPGGILPDSSATAGLYAGHWRDNPTTGALERWSGAAWVAWSSAIRGIAPAGTATGSYTGQYRDNTTTGVPDRWDGSVWVTQEQPTACAINNSASLASSASNYFALAFSGLAMSNRSGMWAAPNPSRIVLPLAGTYVVDGFIVWTGSLGALDGRAEFRVNGSGTASPTARVSVARGSSGNAPAVASGRVIATAPGQYLEMFANQNTGSTITSLIVSLGVTRVSANTT